MNRRLLTGLISAAVVLAVSGTSFAQVTAATWGPVNTYVGTNQPRYSPATYSGTTVTLTHSLSLTSVWQPYQGSYSGPDIYGGMYQQSNFKTSVTPSWWPAYILNNLTLGNSTYDVFRMQGMHATEADYSNDMQNLVWLIRTDQSLLQPGEFYTFGSNSSLSLTLNRGSSASDTQATARWVAVSGNSTIYVGPTFNLQQGLVTLTLSNPATSSWANWTPPGDGTLQLGTLNFNTQGSSITDITHVGFVMNRSRNSRIIGYDLRDYSASLQIIPEPSTTVLLVAGAALLIRRRRSRIA